MGDLISRKALIEDLYGSIFYSDAIPFVENAPTAYDVDAVVEELRMLKIRHYLTMANAGSEALDFAYIHVGSAIDKAIEIVKGGVKNE